ncbi:hypothetical protein J502_2981 [Acinetobacter sp. 1294596]|uniref:Uncharacterized protein n=1 Tax=Acinetobacter radioresistens SK82 TaxID=596318 RepID=A0ABM9YND4_ACIRA|nr:hypothetical protein ACIRA0001_2258 [Acinetobacter radioresistens SK82]EXB80661.1 hypothetical protein J538_2897 [Acinetobacter sp. 272263]EXF55931.1 hypothetical protein J502_2981 [Acinetobacter sp. 1294596]
MQAQGRMSVFFCACLSFNTFGYLFFWVDKKYSINLYGTVFKGKN